MRLSQVRAKLIIMYINMFHHVYLQKSEISVNIKQRGAKAKSLNQSTLSET